MRVALVGLVLVLGTVSCDDSLRGALEAIQRRQRDLSPSIYYSRPYLIGDGQPEDIGYGYQKSIAPNTAGVFEPVALPSSELGDRDAEEKAAEVRALEKLMLDYLEDSDNNDMPRDYIRRYPASKRSIFRERDDSDMPDAWRRLYGMEDTGKSEEETPVFIPSSFRERFADNRKARLQNAHALVRNFGGLNGGFEEKFGDGEDDNDEYLTALNSIWEKYRGEEDPEEITESDVEELLNYLGNKEDKKRQYGGSYSMGYDFFNSPLAWTKRTTKKEALDLLRREGDDVGRMVLGYGYDNQHKKNYLQDVAFDERYPYRNVQKRFPITKRSPSYYTSPTSLHTLEGQRRKKNSGSVKQETDPKVAEELNDIFSSDKKSITPKPGMNKNDSSHVKKVTDSKNTTDLKTGQKELSSDNGSIKPLEVKKKSIDWSEYFGIDRRRKKSMRNDINDEWLLNQYLKAYGLGKQKGTSEDLENQLDPIVYEKKKRPDDMDAKLRALEDVIIDEAIKYTGAHEGLTDTKEAQEVKNKVMAQLAAAYSLEKMRRALGEFKSSIAAQKAGAPASHNIQQPKMEKQDMKSKRIAVKKEKVDIAPVEGKVEKKDNHEMSNIIKDSDRDYEKEDILDCPILQDIDLRCNQVSIISGEMGEMFQPLCTLHQICYLCGPEVGAASPRGCDATFLSEAHSLCREEGSCFSTARRTLGALRGLRGDVSPQGCDWRAHPCLAQFLAIATRR